MGYSITIGEGYVVAADAADIDRHYASPEVRVCARGTTHPSAPTCPGDELTANSNYRAPSYTGWTDFTKATGLHDLFYGPEDGRGPGLMSAHPGCARLTRAHHARIAAALDRYRSEHPDARPGWREQVEGGHWHNGPWKPETEGLDGNLARLIWLEWWVRWALDNCAMPVIYNS